MGALSPTHWAIIVVLVLLLFGSRKLPDMARGMGQSLRIFKAETQELRNEGKNEGSEGSETASAQQKPAAVEKGSTPEVSTATKNEHVGDSR